MPTGRRVATRKVLAALLMAVIVLGSVHTVTGADDPAADDPAADDPAADDPAADDPAADDPAKAKNISFDDIKFEMKKGSRFKRSMLTKKINELHGKTVKIRGYILPSFQQKGIKQFVLVRDNMECCFGPGAALYDCVLVEMVEGKSTSYTVRPVAVEGEFTIREFKDPDGKHLAIYHLDGVKVK